jgi:DNA-binding transcriptional ArsR family regulator
MLASSQKEGIFYVIADPHRRQLLDLLASEESAAQALAGRFDISFAAVSQHLKVLLEAGLVSGARRGVSESIVSRSTISAWFTTGRELSQILAEPPQAARRLSGRRRWNSTLSRKEFYPHPIEKVWAATTDPAALAVWLMTNDFELRVGKRFRFWNEPAKPEWRGWIVRSACERGADEDRLVVA